jgi:dGTPase
MLRKISDQHTHEKQDLAPYAFHNNQTAGRRFSEKPHPLRTPFQRDRDRVLHSKAFRRLEYKTQVFLNGTGDHLRTRLTHTIEVAAICRTIARALYLNEDLAETIALAHDLGHTPFGHTGERSMNKLLKEHGGFDHNMQSLRVVDTLEQKYPHCSGLNLSWEVRTGLLKHRDENTKLDNTPLPISPTLEAQIADIGDDLTYYGHDIDDGLEAGFINHEMLEELELWNEAAEEALAYNLKKGSPLFLSYTIRCFINMMVKNVVEYSNKMIENNSIKSYKDVQKHPEQLINFSPTFLEKTIKVRDFLYKNIYFHKDVLDVNNSAAEKMEALFYAYIKNPTLMGEDGQARIKIDGLHRAVADYIAGMTDRFTIIEHKRCCSYK